MSHPERTLLPLPHMLRLVHIYKGWLVLGCSFSAGAHSWEIRTSTLLESRAQGPNQQGGLDLHTLPNLYTLDRRWSVKTLQTSPFLTTIHGWLPSQISTRETGLVARSLEYSTRGSAATGLVKGNFDEARIKLNYVLLNCFCPRPPAAADIFLGSC